MAVSIPEGSIELQTGLWGYLKSFVWDGVEQAFYDIYSADGYCFWEVNQPENYDEEGNLKPPAERVYATVAYTACRTVEEVNANFISVPIEEGFEIVSIGDDPVTE